MIVNNIPQEEADCKYAEIQWKLRYKVQDHLYQMRILIGGQSTILQELSL